MKKVYSTDDGILAGHIHSILEENGISCWIKNLNLSGAMGELPPIECWPEIWLIDEDDYGKALDIVHTYLAPTADDARDWKCECGEILEAQYRSCWKCGRNGPAPDEHRA